MPSTVAAPTRINYPAPQHDRYSEARVAYRSIEGLTHEEVIRHVKRMSETKLMITFSHPDMLTGETKAWKAIGQVVTDQSGAYRVSLAKLTESHNNADAMSRHDQNLERVALELLGREFRRMPTTYIWEEITTLRKKLMRDEYTKAHGFATNRDGAEKRKTDAVQLARLIGALDSAMQGTGIPPRQFMQGEDMRLHANANRVYNLLRTISSALRGLKGSFFEGINNEIGQVMKAVGQGRDNRSVSVTDITQVFDSYMSGDTTPARNDFVASEAEEEDEDNDEGDSDEDYDD